MVTRRTVVKGGAGALAVVALGSPARSLAQDDHGMPLPEGCELLAGGLEAPRFVAVGEDGSVYVTEAGTGGDEPVYGPGPGAEPGEGTPADAAEPGTPMAMRGASGRVTKVAADGTVTVVASGLASYLIGGFEATGPAGIALHDGAIWVTVGGAGPAAAFLDPIPQENSLLRIDEATGEATVVADLGAFERANNPDGRGVDSNLYGVAVGSDGRVYVADAGGNDILTVDPASGEVALFAVVPPIEVPSPDPATPAAMEIEPVPTSVRANPAGGVWVSLLSAGPFPPGAAQILAIGDDGTAVTAVAGLTMCTDLAVGPDGHVYAVEFSTDFLSQPPAAGRVVRVNDDGSLEAVVEGLPMPNGIAFDAEGNLFIAAGAVTMPGAPAAGMLLRCAGVAASM